MAPLLTFYLVVPALSEPRCLCNSVCLYGGDLELYLAVLAQSETRRLCNSVCLYGSALAVYPIVPDQSEPRRLCNSDFRVHVRGALVFYLIRLCISGCLYGGALASYLIVPAQSEPRRLCNSESCTVRYFSPISSCTEVPILPTPVAFVIPCIGAVHC
jgi:hypothetical protein